jgi:ribosomal protein S18 acetylase RimI-like enzyme
MTKLVNVSNGQCLTVKTWFSDHNAIYTWGGPNMTYPMSDTDFLNLLNAPHINSFCLQDEGQQIIAFGQHYLRLERHHLGRLVVNPSCRGQGLGKILIQQLLAQAFTSKATLGASLFVFRDNTVAYNCYQSLGFIETDYPEKTFPRNMQNCAYMVLPAQGQR